MKTKTVSLLLYVILVSTMGISVVSAPARRTEYFGRGTYRIKVFTYDKQMDDWPPFIGGVAEVNVRKVTDFLHPRFGYGRLELVIKDGKEEQSKTLISVNIDESEFYPLVPGMPLRVDFSGEADFLWGTPQSYTDSSRITFNAVGEDGDPVGAPDRFRVEIGDGEPVIIGEKASYSVSEIVIIPKYETLVFRGNVAVVGGAESYFIAGTSYQVLPGDCLVFTAEGLTATGSYIDGGSIDAGPLVFQMDGKGNDLEMSSLDGKGNDLRISNMAPIIIDGGDTIVADGGYTVIRGANDSFYLGVDQFIRGNFFIKNPPLY